MRFLFSLALLVLPATAFAQTPDGPNGSVPVVKCDPFSAGSLCAAFDGTKVYAARGVERAASAAPAHKRIGG